MFSAHRKQSQQSNTTFSNATYVDHETHDQVIHSGKSKATLEHLKIKNGDYLDPATTQPHTITNDKALTAAAGYGHYSMAAGEKGTDYYNLGPRSTDNVQGVPLYSEVGRGQVRQAYDNSEPEEKNDLNADDDGIAIEENDVYHTTFGHNDLNAEEEGIVITENDVYHTQNGRGDLNVVEEGIVVEEIEVYTSQLAKNDFPPEEDGLIIQENDLYRT